MWTLEQKYDVHRVSQSGRRMSCTPNFMLLLRSWQIVEKQGSDIGTFKDSRNYVEMMFPTDNKMIQVRQQQVRRMKLERYSKWYPLEQGVVKTSLHYTIDDTIINT